MKRRETIVGKNVGDKMKVAEPKCPECGENEFTYKYIMRDEDLRSGLKDRKVGRALLQSTFAIAFCVSCGHIVGFAGR